jgi:uncharacterized membrane protein YbhN (UPF0104 family)
MRQTFFLILKIGISAGLLYLALRGVNFGAIQSRLGQIEPLWILAALVAALLQLAVSALRWREIAIACGADLPVDKALRFNLIGAFFNQTLPSTIGGDGVRLWLVQRSGASWQAASYSVLLDRAIGLIVLAAIVVVSLPWSLSLIANEHAKMGLLTLNIAAMLACLVFLAFGRLNWPWLQSFWPTRHLHACAKVANRVMFSKRSGPQVLLLSLINHLLTIVIAWCAGLAIAAPVSFYQLMLLIPPIGLITLIPISIAGWGVREQAMQAAFRYAGLATADGVTISILTGAIMFLLGALGGLVWLLSSEKAAKGADAMEIDETALDKPLEAKR